MIFGSKNKEQKSSPHPLTEEDIRSRLYGGAVGVAADAEEEFLKKSKARDEKKASESRGLKDEQTKIQKELELLKKDLEQTKRKLDRIRGVRAKKLRLLAVYLAAFLIAAALVALAIKHLIFSERPTARTAPVTAAVEPGMIYSIQAAVYGDAADAQRFSSDLNSKGYETFIEESRFKSGKVRFTVYAGTFKDKKSASRILDRLKAEEGLKDSFIVPTR